MKYLVTDIEFYLDEIGDGAPDLQLSLKYADSQYIDNVDKIMQIIEDNSSL